ncbi:amidohydrolase family protein [Amycolatopsis acidicola]|uniref:Amidohydrolase family protein n=2 Tax=Amycolatopsis acidicola TaxID=2596893 RepID=A0A5N0UZM8_9PSEU|nr:amidohydrolase family protein [Amycolatopsis acidicola]
MHAGRPKAAKMGVWNGRIVGFDDDLSGLEAGTVVDAGGRVVLPGFIDSHTHLGLTGLRGRAVDIAGLALGDAVAAIEAAAAGREPGGWVEVVGYDPRALGRKLAASDLSGGSCEGRKIWVRDISSHSSVVSPAVLEAAGITSGELLDGRLEEDDQQIVLDQRLPYPPEDIEEGLLAAGKTCLAQGITTCVEAGVGGGGASLRHDELSVYLAMAEAGTLPLRTCLMLTGEAVPHFESLGLAAGFGGDWLSVHAQKMWLDGGMLVRSAAVTEPFVGSEHPGALLGEEEEILERIVAAHRAGWQLAIHAIGDRAIDAALDGLLAAQEKYPRADARHRIEHAGMVREDHLPVMGRLGLGVGSQPCFLWDSGDDYANIVGPHRVPWLYRGKSFLDNGIKLLGSTDRPLPGSPLRGIQFFVERRSSSGRSLAPEERISRHEAVAAFTATAAWGSRREHLLGTLEVGKAADYVVLEEDPFAVETSRIGDIPVAATYIDGVPRWQR